MELIKIDKDTVFQPFNAGLITLEETLMQG